MRRTKILSVLFLTVALFGYSSCGKKEAEKQKDPRFTTKQEKITDDKPEYLLNGLSIGGIRINDTANHLKVTMFTPVVASKEVNYSLKPISIVVNQHFKDFVRRAKEQQKHDSIYHTFNIRTVFVNSNGNLISSLFEQTECFVNSQKSVSHFGVTYLKSEVSPLAFKDVFPLNEESFGDFKSIFGEGAQPFGLADFLVCDFAVGIDSLFIFIPQTNSSKQVKLAADIQKAEAFMAHGS